MLKRRSCAGYFGRGQGWQICSALVGVLLAAGAFGWVHPGVVTAIRQARPEDEPELRDIDAATWAAGVVAVLAEALGGRGRVVLLLREAGMGKSMR
jgi:hypothetical protein